MSGEAVEDRECGDDAGVCNHCGSTETHVSYEDISASYCRECSRYFRAAVNTSLVRTTTAPHVTWKPRRP